MLRLMCCFAVVILLLTNSVFGTTLADSVAWWKLGSTYSGEIGSATEIVDCQPNPISGYAFKGTPSWTSTDVPFSGQALALDGKYVDGVGLVSEETKLNFTDDLTLFARVKAEGEGGYVISRKKDGGYAGKSWYLYAGADGSSYTMSIYTSTGGERAATAKLNVPQATWLNVFGTFDPGVSRAVYIYDINGNLLASKVTAVAETEMGITPAHMCIGGLYGSDFTTPYYGYGGEIESVAIWNDVLSADDMAAIAAIPEPASLLFFGGIGLFIRRRS